MLFKASSALCNAGSALFNSTWASSEITLISYACSLTFSASSETTNSFSPASAESIASYFKN